MVNKYKLLRGYTEIRFVPILDPGVRWIDGPELEIVYYGGGLIQTRRYHSNNFDLRNTSLRSFIDNNPNSYIGIFQATHYPTGQLISVERGNIQSLDFRQPDMFYRMVVINDLVRPEHIL